MSSLANDPSMRPENDFVAQGKKARPGALAEMWAFLRHTKKWWLTPIVLAILLLGVLVFLSSTAAAPFIYTLF